jgi:filamentous hemagglutinin family protein
MKRTHNELLGLSGGRSLLRRLIAHPLECMLALVLASTPLGGAFANPLGGQVAAGSATIQGQGTSTVTVTQSSQSTIINWNTFNIAHGELTQFIQPNASSVALNRVTGGLGPSQIYGTIKANGQIFLVNPDGILFGLGSRVDAAGFLATTNNIRDADFMAGRYNFNIPGRLDASIVNLGHINATNGGFAALVAPGVRNNGVITANLGHVALASGNGFTLDFYGDKLITLQVGDQVANQVIDVATGQPLSALVKNEGRLRANGGTVSLTAVAARHVVDSVINNTGVIEANSVGTKNGMIVLGAATAATKPADTPTQNVVVSGTLSARGARAHQKGGTIVITGESVALRGAKINASGGAGGGTVLIGGDTGGGHANPAAANIPQSRLEHWQIATASMVSVDAATTINASATQKGDGGKVVVWSNGLTSVTGLIAASGGPFGGNGGFVETSGHSVNFDGLHVNTSARAGTAGLWLVDPFNLTINADAAATIVSNLANSNVLVQTTAEDASGPGVVTEGKGDIDVASSIRWEGANSLTLSAYRNINVAPGVTIANIGAGGLTLHADNSGTGVGGIFFNGFSTADFTQSTGTISLYYNVNSVIGVQVNPNVPNQLQLHMPNQAAAAYITDTLDPWNAPPSDPGSPDSAMNTVFGAGSWTKFYGFNSAALGGMYKFVYIDGGGNASPKFNAFVSSNTAVLQDYVFAGGALFVNAARWTNGTDPVNFVSGTLNVGFGATLQFDASYSLASNTGTAINPDSSIFHGPFGVTGTSWSGTYFSHDIVAGSGLQNLISGTAGPVLAYKTYGAGVVMIGGITSPFFHSPQQPANSLLANVVSFTASKSTIPNSPAPPPQTPQPPPIPDTPPPPPAPADTVNAPPPPNQVVAPPSNNDGNQQPTVVNLTTGSSSTGGSGNGGNGNGGNGNRNHNNTGTNAPTSPGPPPGPGIGRTLDEQRFSGVPPIGETRFRQGELVVQVSNTVPASTILQIAKELGITLISSQNVDLNGRVIYRFQAGNRRDIRILIRALEKKNVVASAQPNYTFRLSQSAPAPVEHTDSIPPTAQPPAETDLANANTAALESLPAGDSAQYVIDKMHLVQIHGLARGRGVVVAVIDSEIDANHPDLKGVIVDRFDATQSASHPHPHGTGMAGAIAAHRRLLGVAPGVRLIAIKAFDEQAASAEATSFQILKGLDYAIAHKARVINMSFAGPHDPMMERTLKLAHDKGIILVAAAGNAGPRSPPLYPGADKNVIAVTASDYNDRPFAMANRGRYIAVAAPGVDVMVPAPGNTYQLTTGTSVATAHVSGVAALMVERKPTITPDEVRAILMRTATPYSARPKGEEDGAGLVDPIAALKALGPAQAAQAVPRPAAPTLH